MYKVSADGQVNPLLPGKSKILRRQDLPEVYALNGAIYICRTSVLLKKKTFYPRRTCAYVMPAERSIDIDMPRDLIWAEFLVKQGLIGF